VIFGEAAKLVSGMGADHQTSNELDAELRNLKQSFLTAKMIQFSLINNHCDNY